MKKIVRIVDFETSGGEANAPIEVGWTDIDIDTLEISAPKSFIIKTDAPIHPTARGVHHITDEEIANGISFDEAISLVKSTEDDTEIVAFSAHNVDTDAKLMNAENVPWVCTYKSGYTAWPEAPDYKNQTLRYWLDTENNIDRNLAWPPHRGGPDSYVTAWILKHLLKTHTLEQMIDITSKPMLLHTVPIGKEKGKKWDEISYGFIDWLLKQSWIDESLRYTAETEMDRRKAVLAEKNAAVKPVEDVKPVEENPAHKELVLTPPNEQAKPVSRAAEIAAQTVSSLPNSGVRLPLRRMGFRHNSTDSNNSNDPSP